MTLYQMPPAKGQHHHRGPSLATLLKAASHHHRSLERHDSGQPPPESTPATSRGQHPATPEARPGRISQDFHPYSRQVCNVPAPSLFTILNSALLVSYCRTKRRSRKARCRDSFAQWPFMSPFGVLYCSELIDAEALICLEVLKTGDNRNH